MKFAVLALAATALAAPRPDGPPSTDGICAAAEPGPDGTWIMKGCPLFVIPPGSPCTETPEDLSKPYPDCVSLQLLFLGEGDVLIGCSAPLLAALANRVSEAAYMYDMAFHTF